MNNLHLEDLFSYSIFTFHVFHLPCANTGSLLQRLRLSQHSGALIGSVARPVAASAAGLWSPFFPPVFRFLSCCSVIWFWYNGSVRWSQRFEFLVCVFFPLKVPVKHWDFGKSLKLIRNTCQPFLNPTVDVQMDTWRRKSILGRRSVKMKSVSSVKRPV